MGYIGMCSPKGYGFSTVLIINRVWCTLVLNWVCFLEEEVLIIIDKTINKSPSKIISWVTESATTVIDRESNFWFGHIKARENLRFLS